jgi:hypothetical protein
VSGAVSDGKTGFMKDMSAKKEIENRAESGDND